MRGAVRGVIFDLDGTLADTHPMAIELIGGSISDHGGPDLDADEVVSLFGPNEKGILRNVLGEGWETAWKSYLASYAEAHEMCPEPFEGMSGLLGRLRALGCHMAVITGKTPETGQMSVDLLGLGGLFSHVLGGSMDGVIKRRQIGEIIEDWRVPPEAIVYVGDTASDVTEAAAAGVRSVAACWSSFADREAIASAGPDETFESVAAFSDWLLSRARSARTGISQGHRT